MDHTNNTQRDKQRDWVTDREHLKKLVSVDVDEELTKSSYCFVTEELLESLSCVQLDNIDVDIDHSDCTTAATYFQPIRSIDNGMKQLISQRWFELDPGQAPRLYPEYKAAWFTGVWHEPDSWKGREPVIDRFGGSAWRCIEYV